MEVPSIFLNRILAETAKKNASDLHLNVGSLPIMRANCQLAVIEGEEIVTSEILNKIIETFTTPEEVKKLKEDREIVLVKNLAGNFRFRVNIFYQKDLPALSFHNIPQIIKTFSDLNLPQILNDFLKVNSGLLIIAGPYGSGKTTTSAAFVEEVNKSFSKSIITIEDPIEYLFVSKKSVIVQRQIGRDVKTVTRGLDYCLNEDVDLVYVSEIRNDEDFLSAIPIILELAAGNCLVILEINTDSSIRALEKVLTALGKKLNPEAARYTLVDTLRGVIAQKLLPHRGGGMALATEVLLNNSAVKSLVREGKIYQLESVMQTSRREGMIDMNKSLESLLQSGEIKQEDIN